MTGRIQFRITGNMALIKAVQDLAAALPLEKQYQWEVPSSCPITIPPDVEGVLARNIYLKENLHESLQNDEDLDFHYWVIREWGGIRNFRRNEENDRLIHDFRQKLPTGKLSKPMFSVIPSLSKLAAFWKRDAYAIYDSRAIFSLNWLLFRHTEKRHLYPQPPGRNADLVGFEPGTLYRLAGLPYRVCEWQTAYSCYCEIVRELSREALGKPPYYLEMLLFVAAPKWIPNEIKENVQVIFR